jgi:hypothetical protein
LTHTWDKHKPGFENCIASCIKDSSETAHPFDAKILDSNLVSELKGMHWVINF